MVGETFRPKEPAPPLTWQDVAVKFFELVRYLATILAPVLAGGALYYSHGARHESTQAAVTAEAAHAQGVANQEHIEKVGRQVQRFQADVKPRTPFE